MASIFDAKKLHLILVSLIALEPKDAVASERCLRSLSHRLGVIADAPAVCQGAHRDNQLTVVAGPAPAEGPCPGHPRFSQQKTWMAVTSTAMTTRKGATPRSS